jgi:superfamily II DNA or RNA helicase
MKTLYPSQAQHVARLNEGLTQHGAVIDSSETGVGKTICAIACAKEAKPRLTLVVCPKAIIPQWEKELEESGLPNASVLNWEKLRAGNTIWGTWEKDTFRWNKDIGFLVFDEAQRAKSTDSKNAKLVRDARDELPEAKLMLLSATLANSPLEMRAAFHVLGLCKWKAFYSYIRKHLACVKDRWGGLEFKGGDHELDLMREAIYGRKKGSRVTREELKEFFSDNEIVMEPLNFGDEGEIQKLYEAMEAEIAELEQSSAEDKPSPLVVQLRARQAAEILKVPYMVEATSDLVAEGKSVAIFVNFRATLQALCEKLGTTCSIYGEQPSSWRKEAVSQFQLGVSKVIVVMTSAGGVGLSLHDTYGSMPRATLISPSWDEKEIIQALGRCHRAGGKSMTLQRILIASGTVEEKVTRSLMEKTARVEKLNDAKDFLNETSQTVSKGASQEPTPDMPTLPTTEKLAHEERAHSKHSPSSLATKLACPGFVNDQTRDKSAADRGSLGHEMVEKQNFSMAPEDNELTEAALKCYEFIQRFEKQGTVHHQEIKVKMLDQSGHVDHVYIQPDGSADLVDLKFSFAGGYKADSPQFWAYCVGVWDKFPQTDVIRVWILLPFLDEVDTETFTRAEHYDLFSAAVLKIIEQAEAADPAQFRVGRHCSWCARIKNCRKWAEFGIELANRYLGEKDKYALPETTAHGSEITDPETLAVLWRIAPILKTATEGWRKAALESRLEGNDIPGLDLFERKGVREITDALGAYEAVKDTLTAEELLSAADLKVGALEKLWQGKQPRGSKKASLVELTQRLMEASALTSGSPTYQLREIK